MAAWAAMDDLAGRTLGPYQLGDRIGTGGMATVYRGVHRALGLPRAVKVLLPAHAADPTLVERFRSEAKLAGSLRHPNIVSIYDVGEEAGLFYLVMDLVEGVQLRALLEHETGLPLDRAVEILRQLASALDYAHAHGVIHRDVKAGNVLVGPNDHVSLFDFGIARGLAVGRVTKPGLMVGTPHYLAPEVISGDEGDRRADLYALGILAYEMLTGRLPFVGSDTMTVLYAQVNKAPPPLRAQRPELPGAVERVVRRQLAKRPEDRYPTADGFVSALAEAARESAGPINSASVLGVDGLADAGADGLGAAGVRAPGRAGGDMSNRSVPALPGDETDTPTPLPHAQPRDDIPTPASVQRPVGPRWRDPDGKTELFTPLPQPRPARPDADDQESPDLAETALQPAVDSRTIAPPPARRRSLSPVLIGVLRSA